MSREEARRMAEFLAAAFPNSRTSPETLDVFEREIALLADSEVAWVAARTIARSGDRFPTIKEIRGVYRGFADRRYEEAERERRILEMPRDEPRNPGEWEALGRAHRELRASAFATRVDGSACPDPAAADGRALPRNRDQFNREWGDFVRVRFGAGFAETLRSFEAEVHGDASAVEREVYET